MKAKTPARVLTDMTEQRHISRPSDTSGGRSDDGMRVLSYLLAGLLFYGGLGYLGATLFNAAWLLPVGIILGVVLSIYAIIKRYGSMA